MGIGEINGDVGRVGRHDCDCIIVFITVVLLLLFHPLVTTGLMPCLGSPRVTLRKTAVHILQIYLRSKTSKA